MIEARIGGDGLTAPYLSASDPIDQVAMIDRWLVDHDLMYLEIKRDDPRSWFDYLSSARRRVFMRVGVVGDRAAAEYVRGGLECADPVVCATFNVAPPSDDPQVPYGYGRHFPSDTVVPLAEVRQLMIDFVTTGEWSHAVPWREHEHLVA